MGAKQVWMPTRSARNRVLAEHGHLSKEETFALIGRARAVGGVQVLVTHPEWVPTFYSVEHQRALAVHGNVMFQRCFVSTTHLCGFVPFETIERATDLGQPDTPPPVEGMRLNAERLCGSGFSVDDVRRMMQANPTRLLTRENT